MKNTSSLILALVFTVAVSTIAVASSGGASDDRSLEANTKGFPATSPLVIPAAAFATKGNNPSSHYMAWFEGYLQGTALSGGCVQAPAYLPDNTEVTSFYISYIDEDGSENFYAWLTRTTNTSTASFIDLATVVTSGSDPLVRTVGDTSITEPIVNLPGYSYYVSACLPSASTKLISARIYFETTDVIFRDGFESGNTSAWLTVQ